MEKFQYILSKQGEFARAYKEQQYKIRLEKNRAEKRRVKVKKELKLDENKD